jgi:hypothetical protein
VDDLDIRSSSVGGYHVSYMNDLAQGTNKVVQYSATGRSSEEVSLSSDDDIQENEKIALSQGL